MDIRDIGDVLCKPWGDVSREFMGNSKSVGAEQVKKYEGSFDKATANRVDTMTFTKLVDILAKGLTEDGIGQFAVVPGKVFFKTAKLGSLKFWYNKNAKYNSADIGVDLNKTQVKISSVVCTVLSVEDGMYSLSDSDIKIDQWQLLQCRYNKDEEKDNALVTLENNQQKYILSLVAIHTIVWTSFVQFLLIGQPNKNGVTSVGTSGMVEDWSKRELSSDKKATLEGVAKMRRLSKLAFLNTSVADTFQTLPVRATGDGHAGDGEATSLRAFASSEGSLCKLDFLGGLGGRNGAEKTGVDAKESSWSKCERIKERSCTVRTLRTSTTS
ncbi:unnamed protein product [Pylaiella littoralis]